MTPPPEHGWSVASMSDEDGYFTSLRAVCACGWEGSQRALTRLSPAQYHAQLSNVSIEGVEHMRAVRPAGRPMGERPADSVGLRPSERSMTARTARAPSMSEADLLAGVLELCKIFRWRTAHFRPAKTVHGWRTAVGGDGAGFPDLVLVRAPRVLFVELKAENGRLSLEQREWADTLATCPTIETYTWRPADLEAIAVILQSRERGAA